MVTTDPATRAARAVGSALMIVAVVAGCALAGTASGGQSTPPAAPEPSASSSSASSSSAPAHSASSTAAPATVAPPASARAPEASPPTSGTRFTTRNGTASFVLPEGWSLEDISGHGLNHNNESQWYNEIEFVDERQRTVLRFLDGPFSDTGPRGESTVVAQRPVVGDFAAAAWMLDNGGRISAHVALVDVTDDIPFPPGV